jgi:hypothetical protein
LLGVDPVVRKGFENAPPRERAAFGMLSTFAATIVTSRLINYVLEQRRPAPRLRSGTGAGLTLGELALLAKRDNPYWDSEKFALIEAAGAGLAALALVGRFYRSGRDARRRTKLSKPPGCASSPPGVGR